jgi:hypothetical protein
MKKEFMQPENVLDAVNKYYLQINDYPCTDSESLKTFKELLVQIRDYIASLEIGKFNYLRDARLISLNPQIEIINAMQDCSDREAKSKVAEMKDELLKQLASFSMQLNTATDIFKSAE